jgi:hypothetical protein
MSEVQRLIVKENGEEYELYVQSKTAPNIPEPEEEEPGYRDLIPTVNIQEVHDKIRGYTKFALGAFKNFSEAEVEEVTIKFGLKLGGKAGIPFVTEGSAESNFEIEVKCKFPKPQSNSSS